MITFSLQTNLAQFNSTLARYIELTSKTPDEALEAKGRDLGIKLFKGFRDHKWGGAGKHPGLARAELAARTAAGRGTKVRSTLLAKYREERAAFNSSLRSVGQLLRSAKAKGTLDQISGKFEERSLLRRLRSNLWRTIVGKEISLRQAGIGVLAASFLWYRTRSSQARGTYLVKNRTGNPLGAVEKGDGYLRITGLAAGLAQTDARYGIVARALANAEADMATYISRKERENFAHIFGSAA